MKKTGHDGDCSMYSSLSNNMPEDGICTYGYGKWIMFEEGSRKEMYSSKLLEKLEPRNLLTPEQ